MKHLKSLYLHIKALPNSSFLNNNNEKPLDNKYIQMSIFFWARKYL